MYVLGINGGVRLGYRDASAVLTYNGKVIAAVEEERLNRIKASPHQLPELSIRKVLEIARVSIQEVDVVATHGSTWGEQYETVLKNYFQITFGYAPTIMRFHHHDCHAAGAFFSSGFDQALVFSMDNSGDGVGTQITLAEGNTLKILERIERPNSLGIFYGMATQYCGFVRDRDEYKVMGLAPYGRPLIDLSEVLKVDSDGFDLNLDFVQKIEPGQPQPSVQQAIYSKKLTDKFGTERWPHEEYTQYYKDFAASAQAQLEAAIVSLVKKYIAQIYTVIFVCFCYLDRENP